MNSGTFSWWFSISLGFWPALFLEALSSCVHCPWILLWCRNLIWGTFIIHCITQEEVKEFWLKMLLLHVPSPKPTKKGWPYVSFSFPYLLILFFLSHFTTIPVPLNPVGPAQQWYSGSSILWFHPMTKYKRGSWGLWAWIHWVTVTQNHCQL